MWLADSDFIRAGTDARLFPVSAYAVIANLCDVPHPESSLGEPFLRLSIPIKEFSPYPYQLPHARNCPRPKVLRTLRNSCVMSLTSEAQESARGGYELAAPSTVR